MDRWAIIIVNYVKTTHNLGARETSLFLSHSLLSLAEEVFFEELENKNQNK